MESNKLSLISPTILTEEEVNNPLGVIVGLFDGQSSEYYKKDLWEMFKAALQENSWTYKNDPSTAVWLEKDFSKLMDALWLMLYDKETEDGEIKLSFEIKSREEQGLEERMELSNLYPVLNLYRGRIRRLTMAEIENPFMAIKLFFKFHNLQQWKETLGDWKDYALANSSLAEAFPDHEFVLEYENLEKLLEVAFLFNKQSESRFYAEDEHYLEGLINDFNNRNKTRVTKRILKSLFDLLDELPPAKLCRNLRKTILEVMQDKMKGVPKDFAEYLADINKLTQFLDVVTDEINTDK